MDHATKPLTEDARKIIYNLLADCMLDAVEQEAMAYEDGQESAGFILDQLDNIQTYGELTNFLTELSKKWPTYSAVLTHIKSIEHEHKDDQKLDKIEQELQQLSH